MYQSLGKTYQEYKNKSEVWGGYSPWMDIGDILGQGSGGSALASQANLYKTITSMFHGSSDLLNYGTVPLLFQYNII